MGSRLKAKLEKLDEGTCFICQKKCDDDAYAHFDCARAYTAELDKRWEESIKGTKLDDD